MLTISKLSAWSSRYYVETARTAASAALGEDSGGGLGEYYSESETRLPTWLVAGRDVAAVRELTGVGVSGAAADMDAVTTWLEEGVAPSGASGRSFGLKSVHGFDLTFCAPKSVSVVRGRGDDVIGKAVADAHAHAIAAAMTYLAEHAGYTRVHNPATGEKDLVRLPGIVAAAFQHETSRAGDPHLHTHVLVPNRQARADGRLVTLDGTSLYHEARAAGIIYQATLRRELTRSMGIEWGAVDARTGMAEIAGVSRADIGAWSQRATQLHEWAQGNLVIDGHPVTPAQLAAAQKATRPRKPEGLSWAELRAQWTADPRGFRVDRAAQQQARQARRRSVDYPAAVRRAVRAGLRSATFTRADLVEQIGAALPVDDADNRDPRALIEGLVDRVAVRVGDERLAHQREGSVRYTAEDLIAEERAIIDMMGARDRRAVLPAAAVDAAGLSADQARAITAIAASDRLVQPLSAPAGAGKTTSLRALRAAAHTAGKQVVVAAPTGRAVDVAVAEGAGDSGLTLDAMLGRIEGGTLTLDADTIVIVDEAGMVGTQHLRALLTAATPAGCTVLLVGDEYQLAPVGQRGGTFAALVADLPWAQRLCEVWRMRDPAERQASLGVRDGGPSALRRAVGWYRANDRLHTGDAVTMAADALEAWQADRTAGLDALLIADRWEIADAINTRIHRERTDTDTPTVTGARDHRIAVGDIVITRENTAEIPVWSDRTGRSAADPVRNGQRWEVLKVDPEGKRIAVRRLADGAIAALGGDYLAEQVTLGYAVSTHAAQGVTADTCHALLSAETATRSLAYVALTRGRHTNTVRLYTTAAGEADHEHPATDQHTARRGSTADAAALLRTVLGRGGRTTTTITAATAADSTLDAARLPEPVAALGRRHRTTVARLRREHRAAIHTPTDRAVRIPTQTRDRAAGGAGLVERTADLQAVVEGFVCAEAGRSGAAVYPVPPADHPGLDESARQIVAAVATSVRSVQPLSCADPGQRTAIITAAAEAARQAGRPAWLTHPASVGETEVVDRPDGVSVVDAEQAVAAMGDPQRRLPPGGLLIVDGAEQLPAEQITALCLHAGATKTKALLVSDPTASGPGRELTDTLTGLPWAHQHGTTRTRATIVERAATWTATHPPAADVDTPQAGRDLPGWLRAALTGAAAHRSPAVIGRPPARATLAGLDPAAGRAVHRITLSPTTVHTLDLTTSDDDGSRGKAAVLTALARTGGGPGIQMAVIPIGPDTAGAAADQPYQRYLLDPETAADRLNHRTWQPPPGSRIVLDGADHLPADTLLWWLRTATGHDLKLVLLTDRAHPGPQRHLTDTLATAAPWAAHHLHHTSATQQQTATTAVVTQLVGAHTRLIDTRLIDTHRADDRAIAEQRERYRQQHRTRHHSRDTGYDIGM